MRDARPPPRCCWARPFAPTTAGPRVFATPEEAVRGLDRRRQGERPRRPGRALRPRRTGPRRHLRRRHGPPQPGGVRGGGGRRLAAGRSSVRAARSWSSATRPGRSRCRSSRRPPGGRSTRQAGREEVLNRRIGRNELAVIRVLHDYVAAQRAYAATGHDGKPAGRYARRFGSDPGTTERALLAGAARRAAQPARDPGRGGFGAGLPASRRGAVPVPRLLLPHPRGPGQGRARAAPPNYVVDGEMTGGFALVAWPVHYDASGVMTFVVNQDGVRLREGPRARRRRRRSRRSRATTPTTRGRPASSGAGAP